MQMTTSWKKGFVSFYKYVWGRLPSPKSSAVGSFRHPASLEVPSYSHGGHNLVSNSSDSHSRVDQSHKGCHSLSGVEHSLGMDPSSDLTWDAHIPPLSQESGWSYPNSSYGMSYLDLFIGQSGPNWSESYNFGTVLY